MARSISKHKHIPERTCISCRKKKPKRELIRVVRTPKNEIMLDNRGKESGRGAYICKSRNCWDDSFKKKRIEHALKVELNAETSSQLLSMAELLFGSNSEDKKINGT